MFKKSHKRRRVFFKGSVSFERWSRSNPSNPSSSLKVAPQSSYIEVHIDTATDEQRDKKIKPPVQVSPVLLSASSPVAGEVSNGQACFETLRFQWRSKTGRRNPRRKI